MVVVAMVHDVMDPRHAAPLVTSWRTIWVWWCGGGCKFSIIGNWRRKHGLGRGLGVRTRAMIQVADGRCLLGLCRGLAPESGRYSSLCPALRSSQFVGQLCTSEGLLLQVHNRHAKSMTHTTPPPTLLLPFCLGACRTEWLHCILAEIRRVCGRVLAELRQYAHRPTGVRSFGVRCVLICAWSSPRPAQGRQSPTAKLWDAIVLPICRRQHVAPYRVPRVSSL